MKIQEIFTNTIQGEGFWSGSSADFIRLFGCPVGCSWCDTGYADGGKHLQFEELTIAEIVSKVPGQRVVITGGEPFIQPELLTLVNSLSGKDISIETSGIVYQEIPFGKWITLSPKTHLTGKPVASQFWERADELKIVVESVSDFDYYLEFIKKFDWTNRWVYVQPCYKEGLSILESVKPCLEIVTSRPWVKLSVQLHKLLGLP